LNVHRDYPQKTKRLVVGQVTICRGCCCGDTERGLADVPVDWLKDERRKRGLLKRVQLTISGCVGPCDVPNVVVITSSSGTEWLGNISNFEQYRSLLD
jgi:cobaltochelatase CobN